MSIFNDNKGPIFKQMSLFDDHDATKNKKIYIGNGKWIDYEKEKAENAMLIAEREDVEEFILVISEGKDNEVTIKIKDNT